MLSKATCPDFAGEIWKRNNLKFFRFEERFQKAPFSWRTSVDGPTVEINLRFQILRRCVDTASGWRGVKCFQMQLPLNFHLIKLSAALCVIDLGNIYNSL